MEACSNIIAMLLQYCWNVAMLLQAPVLLCTGYSTDHSRNIAVTLQRSSNIAEMFATMLLQVFCGNCDVNARLPNRLMKTNLFFTF